MKNLDELVEAQDDSNIERIKSAHRGEGVYLSTTQQIMVGFALCRPDLLKSAGYPAGDIKRAWARLDDSQQLAIISFLAGK